MPSIVLYKSRRKAIKMILLGSVFVVPTIWLLSIGKMTGFMPWLTICFFGLAYPIGLFQLFDRRPQIIIDEIGIFDRMLHKDVINWEIIQAVYPIRISGQDLICLVVDENFRPSRKKGKWAKRAVAFSEAIGAQELNVSLGNVRVDVAKLTTFLTQMLHADLSRRSDLIIRRLHEGN